MYVLMDMPLVPKMGQLDFGTMISNPSLNSIWVPLLQGIKVSNIHRYNTKVNVEV